MVRWWDIERSGTNLPRQLSLGGYNDIKRFILYLLFNHSLLYFNMNMTRKSTDELNAIVKALSKLSLLNTTEEDQRLFDAQQELRRRKKEQDFIDAHFQVITFS